MKKEKLKKRIFESAWQIVEHEGIEQLNVRKIALLSSCSLGSIYNAYGNFQDLLLHINSVILTKLYHKLHETTELSIKNQESLPNLFSALGMSYIEFGLSNRLLWKALFEHSYTQFSPEWYIKHTREGVYQLCRKLSDAYALSETESQRIVGFFWASIHGVSAILLNRKMEMVAELFSTDLKTYVKYCLAGLFKEVADVQHV